MPKKELDIALILGIAANAVALLFFAYVYWVSIPKDIDLKRFPAVVVPDIKNDILKNELNNLQKTEGLPILVEPEEVGKENPFL